MNREKLAKMIDHTQLEPFATEEDITKLCQEAISCNVYSVCIASSWVRTASSFLMKWKRPDIVVCSVVGFPHGNQLTSVKVNEAAMAFSNGVREVDVVINIGNLKQGQYSSVEAELKKIVFLARGEDKVKVILENCYLTDAQKITTCEIAKSAGAHFVKTSTGFGKPDGGQPAGATVEDVELMRKAVGPDMGVKAAGGIRTYADVIAMIEAGANRLGCSSTIEILESIPAGAP